MEISGQSLPDLFRSIPVKVIGTAKLANTVVSGIAFDSRAVKPGDLFVALVGENTDGHRYIPTAIECGAAAVVGMYRLAKEPGVPYIRVADTRPALAYLSAALCGFPARKLTVIGVTGTDGKTTTCNLIFRILKAAGIRAGMVSTVSAVIGDEELDTGFHVTTPEAPAMQGYLANMLATGLTHVVLETTSHGLAQHRVTACEFDIGVVTNITHEHLDYHGSYDAYRAAKGMLFTQLSDTAQKPQGNPRLAVLNHDDQSYAYLHEITREKQVTYGLSKGLSDVWAENIIYGAGGNSFIVNGAGFRFPAVSHLVGDYNVSNCLAALSATVIGLGIASEAAQRGIAELHGVTGRMERIEMGQNFTAIVDFAHTPNALRVALSTARKLTDKRVIAVFGSAGLRDRKKRRMMAEVSIELADLTILTAEDPRTESLDDILNEMADEALRHGGIERTTFWRVPDRGEAIRAAVHMALPGDVVISCGKGHEQSMCFETVEYPWDDGTAVRAALAEMLGVPGPAMPYLPT